VQHQRGTRVVVFGKTERRRSRTYRAVGYTTAPVLKARLISLNHAGSSAFAPVRAPVARGMTRSYSDGVNLRTSTLLVFLLVAATTVGGAAASAAKRPVPLKAERGIAKRVPATFAYVPTWLPRKFHYVAWTYPLDAVGGAFNTKLKILEIHFIAQFPCPGGGWCSDFPDLAFDANAGCGTGVTQAEKTFRFGAITVRWGRQFGSPEAWRCIRSHGHETLISTSSPTVKDHGPSPSELARFVASARPAHRSR
jgi:hypothetical protein